MTNSADAFRTSSTAELGEIYGNLGTANYDYVTHGYCDNGTNDSQVNAASGWDVCTGVGTPHGDPGL